MKYVPFPFWDGVNISWNNRTLSCPNGDAGAYSISRASRYAGLSPAVHLLKNDGSLRMIRPAETFADLTSHTVRDEDGEGAGDG